MSISLNNKAFHQSPYETYKEIRSHDEFAKVKLVSGLADSWVAFSYEAAEAVLKDNRFVKNPRNVFPDLHESELLPISYSMLFVDPPDHKRLRGLVQRAFTPKMIQRLQTRIEKIAQEQVEEIKGKDRVDLIAHYAFPIPIIVICELLGVPAEDRLDFQRWSNTMVELNEDPAFSQQVQEQMIEFQQYIEQLLVEKRRQPEEDLLSELIRAEEDGERLSIQELYGAIMLMIVAGHETTVNLIANGMLALFTNPEQMTKLKGDLTLIDGAIEEILRYNGPVEFSTDRYASESFTFMGKQLQKGDHVLVSLASADHDSAVFTEPESFDITREKSPHLAFGKGIHYCLGAPLARLEGKIAIQTLLQAFPNMSLDASLSDLEWRQSFVIRGLKELPVKVL
ncbi:cytochrome P450 [Shouchella sp. 1P09AA]|uniref:cytochrome P450 family protein n=1 Tax=unclassified Shouchella TaxID=2893065 RepID=UPI0039A1F009